MADTEPVASVTVPAAEGALDGAWRLLLALANDPSMPRWILIGGLLVELHAHEHAAPPRGYLRAYRLPSGHRRLPADEVRRLMDELFAVPTSIQEDQPTQAPKAWESEPVFEGRLPE